MMIIGQTMSGKTTLAKRIANSYLERGVSTIVLDPLNDPSFPASFRTKSSDEFLQIAKQSQSCALFIDEAGKYVGQHDTEMHWCATMSRHWGHNCHFIAQRATQISVLVRDQCAVLAVFKVSHKDAKLLAEEFAEPELEKASQLNKGEYYYISRFQPIEKRRVF